MDGRTGGANAERLYKVKSRLEHIEQSNKVSGRQAGEVQMNDLGLRMSGMDVVCRNTQGKNGRCRLSIESDRNHETTTTTGSNRLIKQDQRQCSDPANRPSIKINLLTHPLDLQRLFWLLTWPNNTAGWAYCALDLKRRERAMISRRRTSGRASSVLFA